MLVDVLEGCGKETWQWPFSKYCLNICLCKLTECNSSVLICTCYYCCNHIPDQCHKWSYRVWIYLCVQCKIFTVLVILVPPTSLQIVYMCCSCRLKIQNQHDSELCNIPRTILALVNNPISCTLNILQLIPIFFSYI
jgi:hypothetical protein